jgi:hypothetical protein
MDADCAIATPSSRYQVVGRPLIVIVHATKKYDRQASVRQPIEETLAKTTGRLDVLEVVDCTSRSYLTLPQAQRPSAECHGNLLSTEFFAEFGELLEHTNTFLFMGGRANRCLFNSFLSILLAKLYPQGAIFSEQPSILNTSAALSRLQRTPAIEDGPPLNFHFHCEAIYPSHTDFRSFSQNPEVLDWSPNMPWQVMSAMVWANRRFFACSGLNVREFVDGRIKAIPLADCSRSNRPINLLYWSSLPNPTRQFSPLV